MVILMRIWKYLMMIIKVFHFENDEDDKNVTVCRRKMQVVWSRSVCIARNLVEIFLSHFCFLIFHICYLTLDFRYLVSNIKYTILYISFNTIYSFDVWWLISYFWHIWYSISFKYLPKSPHGLIFCSRSHICGRIEQGVGVKQTRFIVKQPETTWWWW